MITCDQALELISASLDLPLTTEEQQMLDQHLDGCPECRALLADFQKIHQELSDMTVTPPAALCQGVMDRIKAEEAAEKVVPIRRKARPWVRWGAAAAVFAVVVLGAGSSGMLDIVFHGSTGSAAPPAVTSQDNTQAEETTDSAAAQRKSLPTAEQESAAPTPSATVPPVDEGDAGQEMPAVSSAVQAEQEPSLPQNVTVTPYAGGQAASVEGDSTTRPNVLPAAPPQTPVMDDPMQETVMADPAPEGAEAGLTQEEAEQRLQDWLSAQENGSKTTATSLPANDACTDADSGEASPQLTALGLSADGESWLFAVTTQGGTNHYAVPVDGGAICLLEETD